MNWRDLLYFSKGERRALTLLLCLISISWIILLLTDNKPAYFADENKKAAELVPMTSDTTVNRPDSGKRQIPSSDSKNNFSREKKEFHPRETKNTSERKYFPQQKNTPSELSSSSMPPIRQFSKKYPVSEAHSPAGLLNTENC